MALTKKQREEMRKCVVGPFSEQEKQDFPKLMENIEEVVEPQQFWNWRKLDCARFDKDYFEWWSTARTPNISFQDFKTKYIDATK